MRRCTSCDQKPKLRQTGKSPPHTEWFCPICKVEYYVDEKGNLSKEKPFKWPTTIKSDKKVIWKAPGA